MPIYEFRCPSCGHVFEDLIFRRSDVEEVECPECGAQRVDQLMSAFSCNSPTSSPGVSAMPSAGGCAPGGG